MQEHVYYKSIQDDTPDVLAELLRLEGAVKRYNPRLLAHASSTDRYAVSTAQDAAKLTSALSFAYVLQHDSTAKHLQGSISLVYGSHFVCMLCHETGTG